MRSFNIAISHPVEVLINWIKIQLAEMRHEKIPSKLLALCVAVVCIVAALAVMFWFSAVAGSGQAYALPTIVVVMCLFAIAAAAINRLEI
ncbi:MAG TPA: hypothetical protein VHQ41_01825 [Patescibacteria group bacterium]|jgi:F0F1-type ATP synthase assembly protein I|nr:hypothetical protein [Patescibacteria group bacterium]